ncbi:hypothetical protein BGZ60DRAFT_364605 [Tricladium varicosporioides]|nr:hypothetical protein BGZ60DRAFT_364605 [Hymenoscyphus varicosporioides]
MGFTTGFTGGVTLTLGLAYLTVLAHERNRQAQASSLRSQSRVLTSLLEPTPLPPPQSRAELAREERSTLVEAAKDRWNEEVENAVRWVQRTDWGDVREGMEGAVARLMGKGLGKSKEGVEEAEKVAIPKVQEAVDRSKVAAKSARDQVTVEVDRVADATKAKAQRVAADADAGAHEAIRRNGGTIDAARGAVRDAVSKGIEKGKDVIGKAQAYVSLAEERIESKGQSSAISHSKAVEKALHERYEQPKIQEKTVEETLEERYKPIDQRDNTSLRGV